jgi:hypothetical protein
VLQALNPPQGRAAPSLVLGTGRILPVRAGVGQTERSEPPQANP